MCALKHDLSANDNTDSSSSSNLTTYEEPDSARGRSLSPGSRSPVVVHNVEQKDEKNSDVTSLRAGFHDFKKTATSTTVASLPVNKKTETKDEKKDLATEDDPGDEEECLGMILSDIVQVNYKDKLFAAIKKADDIAVKALLTLDFSHIPEKHKDYQILVRDIKIIKRNEVQLPLSDAELAKISKFGKLHHSKTIINWVSVYKNKLDQKKLASTADSNTNISASSTSSISNNPYGMYQSVLSAKETKSVGSPQKTEILDGGIRR
jgi:hypothetical protein